MNSRLPVATILSILALSVNADSLNSGKISIKGGIYAPLSIASNPTPLSRATDFVRSTSTSTLRSNQSVFFGCDSKKCESIAVQGSPNSYYSLSFLNGSADGVSCQKTEETLNLTGGVLNEDGKGLHLCARADDNLATSDMTIVLTYD